MTSLKSSLLKRSFAIITFTSIIILTLAFYSAKDEVSDLHNLQLEQTAKYLLNFAKQQNYNSNNQNDGIISKMPSEHNFEKKRSYRMWQDNQIVFKSTSSSKLNNINNPFGYSHSILDNGEKWHFFKSHDINNNIVIEIGEDNSIRQEILYEILLSFIIPLILLIPLLLLIIYFGSLYALKPLIELSKIMNRKNANDFRSITLKNSFSETIPVTSAINNLLAKIETSFEKERSFTDHAAHELRTPLAVLKAQTQAMSNKYNYEEIKDLQLGIDRMDNMVSQLLSFARLQNKKVAFKSFNLSDCLNSVLKQLSILAINKNIELIINVEKDIILKGDEFSISLAISNIIDNAIKYSPKNSKIEISLTKKSTLIVKDQGIGLDNTDKKHIFDKFYRNKKQTGIGSGLGLAIVKWICDLHQAKITIENNQPQGTIFKVYF